MTKTQDSEYVWDLRSDGQLVFALLARGQIRAEVRIAPGGEGPAMIQVPGSTWDLTWPFLMSPQVMIQRKEAEQDRGTLYVRAFGNASLDLDPLGHFTLTTKGWGAKVWQVYTRGGRELVRLEDRFEKRPMGRRVHLPGAPTQLRLDRESEEKLILLAAFLRFYSVMTSELPWQDGFH